MRLQLIDKELEVELEAGEVLEWDGHGKFRVFPKLVRGVPWVSPVQDRAETNLPGPITNRPKFTGVLPGMEQK